MIISNYQSRNTLYRSDVPDDVLSDCFDWLDADVCHGFIKYRGSYHHLSEFLSLENDLYWDGYKSESFYAAIIVKIVDDGDHVIVGRWIAD